MLIAATSRTASFFLGPRLREVLMITTLSDASEKDSEKNMPKYLLWSRFRDLLVMNPLVNLLLLGPPLAADAKAIPSVQGNKGFDASSNCLYFRPISAGHQPKPRLGQAHRLFHLHL